MNRLNYFEPYSTKEATHEDQLTRAFLTLLRLSPTALLATYDMIRTSVLSENTDQRQFLPSYTELQLSNVELANQQKNLPAVNEYVSVLISNDKHSEKVDVGRSKRSAVYDGVISFGSQLALVIENKPRVQNVWAGQLSLNEKNVPEESVIHPTPARLSWRDMVVMTSQLLQHPAMGGTEKMLMHDFLEHVNRHFSYLNPFHSFHLCKSNRELLDMRIEAILKEIALEEDMVKYHRGWAHYIETRGHTGTQRIGLYISDHSKENWKLQLFVGLADTMNQARHFYKKDLDMQAIDRLGEHGLFSHGNFHLSHMQLHLLWYATDVDKTKDYIKYWQANIVRIKQITVEDVNALLADLFAKGVIKDKEEQRKQLQDQVHSTKRTRINVAPGLVIRKEWTKDEAETLDREGLLSGDIKEAIIQAFKVMREDPKFLK